MKILRADQCAIVPWRNGGGTTREIAVHRDARQHDDFLWRLSIATVSKSGPFSIFDGVDRTIALIDGDGMSLRSPNETTIVKADTPPFSFRGEAEIVCELVGGATIDLNAMTRRGFFRHSMHREQFLGWTVIEGSADQTFVVINSVLELHLHGQATLGPLDTVAEISPGEGFRLYSDRPADILVVALSAEDRRSSDPS